MSEQDSRSQLQAEIDTRAKRVNAFLEGSKKAAEERQIHRNAAFGGDFREGLILMHYSQHLTPQEIADRTGYSYSSVRHGMVEHGVKIITVDTQWLQKFVSLVDVIKAVWADPSLIQQLSVMQQDILLRRYFIDNPLSLDNLAKEYGVSRERIRIQENNGIAAIRKIIRKKRT